MCKCAQVGVIVLRPRDPKYGKHIENADGFAQVFPEHKFLGRL